MKIQLFFETASTVFRGAAVSTLALLASSMLVSCASEPTQPPPPEWTRAASRTVDNGYIVYVESSEDANPELARFKAEAAALEDLANECTFIPKEARIEDRYLQKTKHMNQAYAKVGLELQLCEQARKTIAPEEVRKMANVPMTEEVKRYQDLLGKPELEDEEVAENEDESASGNGSTLQAPTAPTATGITQPSPVHIYVIRERIWLAKQDVVLAPPATYAAGSPAQTAYMRRVETNSTTVTNFEAAHPEVRAAQRPWSHFRTAVVRPYRGRARPRGGPSVMAPPHEHLEKAPRKMKKRRWRN